MTQFRGIIIRPDCKKNNRLLLIFGILLSLLGYGILTQATHQGNHWAANLAPFAILGGLILMATAGWRKVIHNSGENEKQNLDKNR